MHPRLCEGVSYGTFCYKGSSEEHYYFEINNEEVEVSPAEFREISNADGTHPLRISERLLKHLKRKKILSTGRYSFDGVFSRFILLPLGRGIKRFRPLCRVLNMLMPILTVILFAAAAVLKGRHAFSSGDTDMVLYYILIIISLAIHEFAHLAAGIAYGYRMTEMGILLLGIFPIGAYVAHDEKLPAGRMARLQFSLAGVESNILFAAVLLILSLAESPLSATFAMSGNISMLMALVNLIPGCGLDGENALSALLGVESIGVFSKMFVKNKKFRRWVFRSGAPGFGLAAVFVLNLIAAAAIWVLLLASTVSVFVAAFS